jgi:hypothetical protein
MRSVWQDVSSPVSVWAKIAAADRLNSQTVQSTIDNPGTNSKSRRFRVTIVASRESAIAEIQSGVLGMAKTLTEPLS